MKVEEIQLMLQSDVSAENYQNYIQLLLFLNKEYYNQATQVVSDREYDDLFARVAEFEKKNPELLSLDSPTQKIAVPLQSSFEKVAHLSPMLSLANSYNEEDLRDFDDSVKKELGEREYSYVVEPKFDGSSINLIFENNQLTTALTRGNGLEGENITINALQIATIPNQVDFSSMGYNVVELRGEVVIHKERFQEMNEVREQEGLSTFQNTRNTASGSLRMKDSAEIKQRNLEAFVYNVGYLSPRNDSGGLEQSQWEIINTLSQLGFQSAEKISKKCLTIDEVIAFCQEWEEKRDKYEYDIDGMVIKVNEIRHQVEIGSTSHHPKWAMAFKFKAIKKATKLLNIEYQVGRTGVVTPVAKVAPVNVGGVTVRSISLHNEDNIKGKDIRVGDTVWVERAGDVIPQIVGVDLSEREENVSEFEYIKKCVSCDSELIRREGEAAWRCINPECPAQISEKIIYFVSKEAMNIVGLGRDIVLRFIELGIITDILSIYHLDYDEIFSLEGWKEKSVEGLRNSIEDSKSNEPYRLLVAMGIDHVGVTMAKALSKKVEHLLDFQSWSMEDFENLEDVGPKVAESLFNFFQDEYNVNLLKNLENAGVNLKGETLNTTGKLYEKKIVFTGFRDAELQKKIEAEGGEVANSLSKKTDILIVKSKGSGSSKEKKAEEYGVEIVSIEEFQNTHL